jgi:hypothetical protein
MRYGLALALLLAWSGPALGQHRPPSTADALALVNRYVAAETTGAWRKAYSLVTACRDGGTDFTWVVTGVHVQKPYLRGDTVTVPVIYQTAGTIWETEPHVARFSTSQRADTAAFHVFLGARRHLWIDCNVETNHVAASYLRGEATLLDSASRADWRAARLPRPRIDPGHRQPN